MGCLIEKTKSGEELQVHKFDTKQAAAFYVECSREYKFDRHETWGLTSGFDFYTFPGNALDHTECNRATVHKRADAWVAVFWKDGEH